MKMDIQFKDARWLVNGKRLADMNLDEKNFIDDFFREFKSKIELYGDGNKNNNNLKQSR